MVGTLLACSLVAYALEGATDQGFYFYRIAFITGTLLGLAETARRIQRTNPAVLRSRLRSPQIVPRPGVAALAPVGGQDLVPVIGPNLMPLGEPEAAPAPPERTRRPGSSGRSRFKSPETPAE